MTFRDTTSKNRTGYYYKGYLTVMCDDGFEEILDFQVQCPRAEAEEFFSDPKWEKVA